MKKIAADRNYRMVKQSGNKMFGGMAKGVKDFVNYLVTGPGREGHVDQLHDALSEYPDATYYLYQGPKPMDDKSYAAKRKGIKDFVDYMNSVPKKVTQLHEMLKDYPDATYFLD